MLKEVFDRTAALLLLLLLAPLILSCWFIVRLSYGAPAFFIQQRPGIHGQPFIMLKFRTMSAATDEHGELLSDEQRLNGFGRFLRSSSIDELPGLFNVLKGDMSLVGPRPLLMEYLERYTTEQARRHEVKPGITGWAQVNGRNSITWEEKFALDVWYVDNRSFLLDCQILIMTLLKVFKREGISQEGQATMALFAGSKKRDES